MPDCRRSATPTDHPYGGFSTDVIELLRAAHSSTPLHQLLGLQLRQSAPIRAVVIVEMPVAPGAFNGSGNLHGGAIATPRRRRLRFGGRAAPERSGPARTRW